MISKVPLNLYDFYALLLGGCEEVFVGLLVGDQHIDVFECADLYEGQVIDFRMVKDHDFFVGAFQQGQLYGLVVEVRGHDAAGVDGADAQEGDVDAEVFDHAAGQVTKKSVRGTAVETGHGDELQFIIDSENIVNRQ